MPPLTSDMFPPGMQVIRFWPGGSLTVKVISSRFEKGCFAAFSVIHWGLFPGLAGSLLGEQLGPWQAKVGAGLGSLLGLAVWFHLSRRGPAITLSLRKRKYSFHCVACGRWGYTLPDAIVESTIADGVWTATLSIDRHPIAQHTSPISQAAAEQPLQDFATVLNANWDKQTPRLDRS